MDSNTFRIDYSECDNTKLEFNSIEYYINELTQEISNLSTSADLIPDKVWNKSVFFDYCQQLINLLNKENTRYCNFAGKLSELEETIKETDTALNSLIESYINQIDNNVNYDFYLATIDVNTQEVSNSELKEQLLNMGIDKENIDKILLILSGKFDEQLLLLSSMNNEEIEAYLNNIKLKKDKSLLEKVLIDFLKLNEGSTYVDYISSFLQEADSTDLQSLLLKNYLGGLSLEENASSINSIFSQINSKYTKLYDSSIDLSQADVIKIKSNIKNLEELRDISVSNQVEANIASDKLATISKIGKVINNVVIVISSAKIIYDGYIDYTKYGYELDEVSVSSGYDFAVLGASIVIGGEIGAVSGAVIGSVPGAIVGIIAGTIGGALISLLGELIKEPTTDLLNDAVDEVETTSSETINDIDNWWTTLSW